MRITILIDNLSLFRLFDINNHGTVVEPFFGKFILERCFIGIHSESICFESHAVLT